MSNRKKIVITDNIVTDSISSGITVSDQLLAVYSGEIQDIIKSDERFAKHDPVDFAMMDAGFTTRNKILDLYQTNDNEWLFPVWVDRRLREGVMAMNIINWLVGGTEMVSATSIQGAKLIMDAANTDAVKTKRVVEGTDLPLAIMKLADVAYTLKKRGRAVQASYETYMFQTLNMFARHLDMIANDVALQQVGDAVEVLVKGDGNGNPADVVSIQGDNGLTPEEIVQFAITFWRKSNMPLDTILCGDGDFYKRLMLTTFDANEINGAIRGATFDFPQAMLRELVVLYDPRVPKAGTGQNAKEQLIGLNRRAALTRYVATGSQIREMDTNIRNQTRLGTISEIAGFGKFNDDATMILQAK